MAIDSLWQRLFSFCLPHSFTLRFVLYKQVGSTGTESDGPTAWTSGSMDNHPSHLYSEGPWKEHRDELKYRNWERKQSSYIRWNRWDSPACQKEREGGGVMMGPRRELTACRSLFPLIFIIIRHPGCCSCANIVCKGPTSVCEGSGWAGWVVGGWLYYSISPNAQASLPVTDWKGE